MTYLPSLSISLLILGSDEMMQPTYVNCCIDLTLTSPMVTVAGQCSSLGQAGKEHQSFCSRPQVETVAKQDVMRCKVDLCG